MLAVKGIFNGRSFRLLEKLPQISRRKYKVIITFIEEVKDGEENELRNFTSQSDAFDFWNNTSENIYQDYLIKTSK